LWNYGYISENIFYKEKFSNNQLKNIKKIAEKLKTEKISKQEIVNILKDDKKFMQTINKKDEKSFPSV
jgi:hypothetical protein